MQIVCPTNSLNSLKMSSEDDFLDQNNNIINEEEYVNELPLFEVDQVVDRRVRNGQVFVTPYFRI